MNTTSQHSLYTAPFSLALQVLCACPKKKENNYSKVEFHIPRGLFESSASISGNNWAENRLILTCRDLQLTRISCVIYRHCSSVTIILQSGLT